jgi:hypothetical protein
LFGGDIFGSYGLVKARPPSAGIKFSDGGKQGRVATCAMIDSPVMAIPEFATEGLLCSFFSADLKLLFGEGFPPFVFGFCDFFRQVSFLLKRFWLYFFFDPFLKFFFYFRLQAGFFKCFGFIFSQRPGYPAKDFQLFLVGFAEPTYGKMHF